MSTAAIIQGVLHSLRARAGLSSGIESVSEYAKQFTVLGVRIFATSYMSFSALCRELVELLEGAPLDLVYNVEELYRRYESVLKRIAHRVLEVYSLDEAKRSLETVLNAFIDTVAKLRSDMRYEMLGEIESLVDVFREFSKRVGDSESVDELREVLESLEQKLRELVKSFASVCEDLLYIMYVLYIATGSLYARMFSAILYTLRNLFRAVASGVKPLDPIRGLSCLYTAGSIAIASYRERLEDPKLYEYVASYALWSQVFMNALAVCSRCSWIDQGYGVKLYQERKFAESARLLNIAMFSDIGVECYRHLFSILRIDLAQALEEIREEERATLLQREAEEGGESR